MLEMADSGTEKIFSQIMGSQRILVADDVDAFRRYLVKTLTFFGYETVEATDICTLEKHLMSRACDLVLLDWHLGETTPDNALRIAREQNIPVIVITGDPESVGDVEYPILGKPLHLDDLKSHVGNALRA